jgi:hypothetical protein
MWLWDFQSADGCVLLEKASDIYSSYSDKSREEVKSDLITQDLRFLVMRLRENAQPRVSISLTGEETVLEELRERCESSKSVSAPPTTCGTWNCDFLSF